MFCFFFFFLFGFTVPCAAIIHVEFKGFVVRKNNITLVSRLPNFTWTFCRANNETRRFNEIRSFRLKRDIIREQTRKPFWGPVFKESKMYMRIYIPKKKKKKGNQRNTVKTKRPLCDIVLWFFFFRAQEIARLWGALKWNAKGKNDAYYYTRPVNDLFSPFVL